MLKRTLIPLALLAVSASQATAANAQAPAPKAQAAADVRAYRAANNLHDSAERLAALRQFLTTFPDSKQLSRAHDAIFKDLIENFPDRTAEIDTEVKAILAGRKDYSLWSKENVLAFDLANAGTAGTDIKQADKLSADDIKHGTEPAYDKATQKFFDSPKLTPKDLADQHERYISFHADALAVRGMVLLRMDKIAEAKALAAESFALDGKLDDAAQLQGEIALAEGNNAEALTDFERAQLVGALRELDRDKMHELYRAAHAGSDAGFEAELDATYATLFAPPFTPAKHIPIPAGHTALLELFTGSGCPPCVGGDLAVDALLETYPRTEIVALAYDLHIPEPDPLTSPASVARGELYGIGSTPSYVLDGTAIPSLYGNSRNKSGELYTKLVKAVDPQIAIPRKVQLTLTATPAADGSIAVHAAVTTPALPELQKELTPPPPADKPDAKAAAKPAPTQDASTPELPHLIVNFALVEDNIRYSGENGVRFHRMVVRATARPAGKGFPVAPDTQTTADATFQPTEISKSLTTYLDAYENANDRFGPLHFISKDTTLNPAHLAVVAWVQDTSTHRILQSTFIPLAPHTRSVDNPATD